MSPHREEAEPLAANAANAGAAAAAAANGAAPQLRKRQAGAEQQQQQQQQQANGGKWAKDNKKEADEDDGLDEEERRAREATAPSSTALAVPTTGLLSYPPFSWAIFLFNMFFTWKFLVHRQVGLYYLLQWGATVFLYFYDYQAWLGSFLVWSTQLTALLQAFTAALTFKFLSRNKSDQGYFTDKYTMSYAMVAENSFFQLIAMFQWLYLDPRFYGTLVKSFFVEASFVFFPYFFRDLYWPRTSFRDSYGSDDSNRSQANKIFYAGAILLTKTFYIWAKHFMGFYINYLRFLNRITDEEIRHVYLGNIFGAFALTIGMFLHTLKFKKLMDPRLSFYIYAASYLITLYTFVRIGEIFLHHTDLTIITTIGVAINFLPRKYQNVYQLVICGLLVASRYGYMPEEWHQVLGLRMGHVAAI